MAERILIVDDEPEIAELISLYLSNEGYSVSVCLDSHSALREIERGGIDLAVLDVILPDLDGFALCRKIRERYNYPIIMLTSKVASSDKINGLALGADDYVTKPFDPIELVARVKAQLRRFTRYNASHAAAGAEGVGALALDPVSHRCTLDGKAVDLTPTEFSILLELCRRKGEVVGSEELFRRVWGEEYFSKSTNPIPVHIRHIREKLSDNAENPRYIRTVWGVGYKIED